MMSDTGYEQKTCTRCKLRLPLSAFPAVGGLNRSLHPWCKKCRSLYNADHNKPYVPTGKPRGVPKGYKHAPKGA